MGEKNKLLLPYHGSPMIVHQVEQIIEAGMKDHLIVVLGHQAEAVKAALPEDITTVFNAQHPSGMTSSIQAGIKLAAPDVDGFMICLSDMPRLKAVDYKKVNQVFLEQYPIDPFTIVQPVFHQKEKKNGHPVVFSRQYKNLLLQHKVPEGCRDIIRTYHKQVKEIKMGAAILWDIDTPDDWQRSQQ